jgi:DNA repair exonuclease SbcCD ATPase subunit
MTIAMAEINSTLNTKPEPEQSTGKQWDMKSLLEKVLELQDLLMQAQEKNLLLSAQARELERAARDSEDLKAELSSQALVVSDKTRENKTLHQEFSRISSLLDIKIQEMEEARLVITDLEQQVKNKEQERDILLVMINEMEGKRSSTNNPKLPETGKTVISKDKAQQQNTGSWLLKHLKGQK